MDEFLKSHPMVSWMLAGVAFLVAFVLILKIIEIVVDLRRRMPRGPRSRQLRLGFVETFDLDGDRQLMLVRRDNIEHLVLIGGPNDVLMESGIVRVEPREARATRGAEAQPTSTAPVLAPHAAATLCRRCGAAPAVALSSRRLSLLLRALLRLRSSRRNLRRFSRRRPRPPPRPHRTISLRRR